MKIQKIREVWKDGVAVHSLPLFHYMTETEAFNREACMIHAIGEI